MSKLVQEEEERKKRSTEEEETKFDFQAILDANKKFKVSDLLFCDSLNLCFGTSVER